ncbi:helix-turn-helix domain-containing protein [Flavobacterium segetis]|uniref:helix-turn-helix domain-containing protein n=1 Tax=Flavobacterium segetis TaxID=271157 RepID=UPI0013566DA4|nr:AraC family transcriptional regulator [Flavobacterium segetis]
MITLVLDLYLGISSFAGSYIYIGLIICWVLYLKILSTPEILYGYNFFIEKVQEQRNIEFVLDEIWIFQKKRTITNNQDLELDKKISDKISLYISAIEIASLKNHQLREELVTLGTFANQLKLPKSHLVYLFKYHSKLSFIEFKKVVRVLDAVTLIETNYLNVNTLDSLAKKVGFSSYNTFFTSFKEITGNTPRAISEELRNKIEIKTQPA